MDLLRQRTDLPEGSRASLLDLTPIITNPDPHFTRPRLHVVNRNVRPSDTALDPEIVFLDEPTSGLDPISAGDFDQLVMTLQRTLGLTVFMVTHDLDSLYTACDRIAVLGNGKIIAAGSIADMKASKHPWLNQYFNGKRARAVVV